MKEKRKPFRIIVMVFIVFLLVFSVALLINFYFNKNQNQTSTNNNSCVKDSDCVKMQTTCCPCNAGGKQECKNKDYKLNITCPPANDLICPQVFNCREMNCACVNGECTEG